MVEAEDVICKGDYGPETTSDEKNHSKTNSFIQMDAPGAPWQEGIAASEKQVGGTGIYSGRS